MSLCLKNTLHLQPLIPQHVTGESSFYNPFSPSYFHHSPVTLHPSANPVSHTSQTGLARVPNSIRSRAKPVFLSSRTGIVLGNPGYRLLFLFYFYRIKPFAIHPDYRTLRHKSVGVYFLDEPENDGRFALLGQDEQHLHLTSGIEAVARNDRGTPAWIYLNTFGYLGIAVADDKELHRLARTVHHLVEHKAANVECDVAIDHLFPIEQNEIAGGDDDQIAHQHHAPQCDVAILVDDSGNDVRAARAAIVGKSDAYTAAAKRSPDDASHEGLVVQEVQIGRKLLDDRHQESECKHSINGFDAKPPPQYPDGQYQQQKVDAEISVLHREPGSEIDNRRNARYAPGGDVVGQQKNGPTYRVTHHTDSNHEIVVQLMQDITVEGIETFFM